MATTITQPNNAKVAFRGKPMKAAKPSKMIRKAAKRGLISPNQMAKIHD
jgi:hypothetical protein